MSVADPPATTPARPPPAPIWVKLIAVVAVLLLLTLATLWLTGSGHGPGRHGP